MWVGGQRKERGLGVLNKVHPVAEAKKGGVRGVISRVVPDLLDTATSTLQESNSFAHAESDLASTTGNIAFG